MSKFYVFYTFLVQESRGAIYELTEKLIARIFSCLITLQCKINKTNTFFNVNCEGRGCPFFLARGSENKFFSVIISLSRSK